MIKITHLFTKRGGQTPVRTIRREDTTRGDMHMHRKRVAARAAYRGSSAILAALLVTGAASAQTIETPVGAIAADEGGDVIVTGSRIPRPDLDSNSPVNVITNAEIQKTTALETEQLLNALPQAVAGSGAQSNSGNGSATVNLRNLGAVRTLVLQNGRRIIGSSQDGVVDLNMIPPSLIERVEVVTGGASAVYGSDAMAGVVNFVTKTNFEGSRSAASTASPKRAMPRVTTSILHWAATSPTIAAMSSSTAAISTVRR